MSKPTDASRAVPLGSRCDWKSNSIVGGGNDDFGKWCSEGECQSRIISPTSCEAGWDIRAVISIQLGSIQKMIVL